MRKEARTFGVMVLLATLRLCLPRHLLPNPLFSLHPRLSLRLSRPLFRLHLLAAVILNAVPVTVAGGQQWHLLLVVILGRRLPAMHKATPTYGAVLRVVAPQLNPHLNPPMVLLLHLNPRMVLPLLLHHPMLLLLLLPQRSHSPLFPTRLTLLAGLE